MNARRQTIGTAILTFLGALWLGTGCILAADESLSNVPPRDVLLTDNLGRTVEVSSNEVSRALQPPARTGLKYQIPNPARGANISPKIQERMEEDRRTEAEFQLLPPVPPRLMPYLASQDEFGNTVIHPDSLISVFLLEPLVQGWKYALSTRGLRYSLDHTFTFLNMTDVKQGNNQLYFYTFDLKAKWALFDARSAGTAGWISFQVEAKTGLGTGTYTNGEPQSPKSSLGTLTDPAGIWSDVDGIRVPELAWQQSLRDGEIVVVAGMVNQRNYLDGNVYAHSGRSKFLNSALIHSMVLPLSHYNFGLNLQWQPADEWYAMVGGSAGNSPAGHPPWEDFSWQHRSLLGEFGYAPRDVFGLGPGVYRVQPFVARANDSTEGGLCFNAQQQLGANSPFGWFGRFGFGGVEVSRGAAAQIGSGFLVQGPFKHVLWQRTSNDLLGIGFVWSQPSATSSTIYHQNEYVLETVYALQLTPTVKLQPDLQWVWNPVHNPTSGPIQVFQLQIAMAW